MAYGQLSNGNDKLDLSTLMGEGYKPDPKNPPALTVTIGNKKEKVENGTTLPWRTTYKLPVVADGEWKSQLGGIQDAGRAAPTMNKCLPEHSHDINRHGGCLSVLLHGRAW